MHGGLFTYVLLAALAIGLLYAAFTDMRHRRIANWLNAAIALAAPLFWWATGLGLADIGWQLASALAAFVVLLGMFALRMMGGGDVKLLTALALWIQPAWFLKLIVMMALLGGVLTLVLVAWRALAPRKEGEARKRLLIPYGVAISAAALWVIGAQYFPSGLELTTFTAARLG